MITVNLILQQWRGVLGYEIQPLPGKPDLPDSRCAPDLPDSRCAPDLPDSRCVPDLPDSRCVPDLPDSRCAPDLPEDLLKQLLRAGLDMYIQRYLIPVVNHPNNLLKPSAHHPCIVYHVNPHTRDQPLYLSTEDNTLYELIINFDNLDAQR